MSKYNPLTERLRGHPGDQWKASFSELEEVLGFPLPKSARTGKAWWANDADKSHVKAWTGEGWQADEVDHAEGVVTFRRGGISPAALEAAGALEPVGDLDDADLDVPEPPPPPYAAPDALSHAQPALYEGPGEGSLPVPVAPAKLRGIGVGVAVAAGVAAVAALGALMFRGRRT